MWPLAIAETIVWAALYYVFPALFTEWERDLGWSKTELSIAFTLALVVTASLAPLAGRLIDRGFASVTFTGGALLGAAALVALSFVTELWQFYCAWLVLGVAMGSTLYEACFAVLMRSMGDRARQAITVVTLLAGLAGTFSFPSAHALVGAFGWRVTTLVFAAAVAFVAAPLIWLACRDAEAHAGREAPAPSETTGEALAVTRSVVFWLIAGAAFLAALDHGMIVSHVLPILDDRGVAPGLAVLIASSLGPLQVAGRFVLMTSDRWVTTRTASVGCYAMLGIAGVCLLETPALPWLVVGFVVLQGAGIGISSIMRPMVTAEILGRRNFGVIAGLMGLAHMGGYALGPSVAALVWERAGYDGVLTLGIGAAATATAALSVAWVLAARR